MTGKMLNWFELPVSDFNRAKQFYERILNIRMNTEDTGSYRMGFFPHQNGKPAGCITCGYGCIPDNTGTLIYLNGNPDLAPILARVEEAGGRIILPKTALGADFGYFAHFEDTEGNKVGIHSEN
ncbi:VOC family protein [Pseudoflavitalea sp. G-6-1-2]|uniref:VOC family protein n=1 Tax=Pseudoflavitalea sp. G-6-1-2 TaxID=2728841 RepID=UPI00146BDD9A|nr:VOC family protein [Pseudoflavitalea sp. G-6-1-2]NML20970.1 VOC family protein [Pseudoflavitalea sp. G-6-1-2]